MTTAPLAEAGASRRPALPEFIIIVASMMAMTALSIDIMLPALPAMSDYFGLENPNARQLVLTAYLLGFAGGQLFYGPLSDRFGRKPVLIVGLLIYSVASVVTFLSRDYALFLAARALQGIGGASPRVMALAVVRDLFEGREMARVMSFVMMVFIIVPVIAPSVGQALLAFGHWQWIFIFLLIASLLILLLTVLRLPETRPKAARAPLSIAWVLQAFWRVLSTRQSLGYTVAIGFIFGCLMSYVSSAQQILEGIYGLETMFPIVFGAIAFAMAGASLTNGALVERFGMRRMSHGALVVFVAVAAIQVLLATLSDGPPPLVLFAGLLAVNLFCFGFIMPNFNSMAMEPLQSIAGTGSSFVGFFTTGGAAILGSVIGQHFNDTVVPLAVGYLALSSIALIVVLITERGKLFQPHHSDP
jgi:DHA1 family bicyclomycin/chloramphenicol resistance-like MFS transporter